MVEQGRQNGADGGQHGKPTVGRSKHRRLAGNEALDINPGPVVIPSQTRAIRNYRSRLGERGLARFEVLGRDADHALIRAFARRIAETTAQASELRATVSRTMAGDPPKAGGILAALRRSPLVGADLDLDRPRDAGRMVDL